MTESAPLPDVEPPASQTERCANCGAPLAGPYCSRCGQGHEALQRPFFEMLENLLESLIHFDSRGLRTLGRLAIPGALTEAYLTGRRVAFVPPVRLYIFISALFFLLLAGSEIAILRLAPSSESAAAMVGDSDLAKRLEPAGTPEGRAVDLHFLESRHTVRSETSSGTLPLVVYDRPSDPAGGWRDQIRTGFARAMADPVRFNRALEDLLPKIMFVLVPVFGLILALVELRRRRFLAEHLVFALHLHAFLFLLFSALIALAWAGLPIQAPRALAVLAVAYLALAMRRVYRQGWVVTIAKAAAVTALYGVVFGAALVTAILISLGQL